MLLPRFYYFSVTVCFLFGWNECVCVELFYIDFVLFSIVQLQFILTDGVAINVNNTKRHAFEK